MEFIKFFNQLGMNDVPLVGGKTASLAQVSNFLSDKGVKVPDGFAITSRAYWHYITSNSLQVPIKEILNSFDLNDLQKLHQKAREIRQLIINAKMPEDLQKEIVSAYALLSDKYKQDAIDVAVRSSATAEDLPGASFAGQQESFLHIQGDKQLLESCKKCFASLFTDRAIIYRATKGFDQLTIALSIVVQKMVRSDLAASGVAFSLDTETGFKDVIMINASYGLGEAIVQGIVNPDEYYVFKPTLQQCFKPIIKKELGTKEKKLVYASDGSKTVWVENTRDASNEFCLTDDEIISLANNITIIEAYYTEINGIWSPMDIEWAKDGIDGELYIVQARPETVHSTKKQTRFVQHYTIKESEAFLKEKTILQGQSVGTQIASGVARIVKKSNDIQHFNQGDILITYMTDPDWVPLMQKAGGIITDAGGRTCHAAIVSRELGIPAIIGTHTATQHIQDGQIVTLDCSQGAQGFVYAGAVTFNVEEVDTVQLKKPQTALMVNVADPKSAFIVSQLPCVDGVGLARVEFIIANTIKAHPMIFTAKAEIKDEALLKTIATLTAAYPNKEDFFVESLAQGIGSIAAAFYPRPAIVRFSDFKTNEYRELLGGYLFEPEESNPMLGLRGASRYYNQRYEAAFELECKAIKKVRETMGLTNVICMIPFVRTLDEAWRVITLMKKYGLSQEQDGLKIYMMVEIPSNVLLIDDFCKLFDGFSIGSNDLTQTTLAVDRDSALLAPLFDERDKAVKKMCAMVIDGALRNRKPIGICGQAPSDFPEFADYLINLGITSLSLNPDSVLPFLER